MLKETINKYIRVTFENNVVYKEAKNSSTAKEPANYQSVCELKNEPGNLPKVTVT